MKFLDFIINGGLCGYVEGFDYKKEGHPYNFDNLHDSLGRATKCVDVISNTASKLKLNG